MSERLGDRTTYNRVCGRFGGILPGPTLVLVGGIHGNEHSGLQAALAVLADLTRRNCELHGRVIVLAGNLRALEKNQRYIYRDMNRVWTTDRIHSIRNGDASFACQAEDYEQIELLQAIDDVLHEARGEAYFLDLHTSSAQGCPFLTVGDTLRNREFAMNFPLPLILGLEEQLEGSLLEYLNNRGMVTLGVEGGQHDDPASIKNFCAIIRRAMVSIGMMNRADFPELDADYNTLRSSCAGVPRVVEIRYRFAISCNDLFRMEPGFANFQPIRRGDLVANDSNGEVRSVLDSLILLPLYQGMGDDGFFLATEFSPFWLTASRWMRKLRMGRLLSWMPGVRRHPDRKGVLIVDTRFARWFPLQMFRLAGYRKLRQHGKLLLVTKRKYDRKAPVSYVE